MNFVPMASFSHQSMLSTTSILSNHRQFLMRTKSMERSSLSMGKKENYDTILICRISRFWCGPNYACGIMCGRCNLLYNDRLSSFINSDKQRNYFYMVSVRGEMDRQKKKKKKWCTNCGRGSGRETRMRWKKRSRSLCASRQRRSKSGWESGFVKQQSYNALNALPFSL